MPLDDEQRQKVLDWLSIKCPGFRCPACGASDWSVCGLACRGVPLLRVGCSQCAFVAQFAAAILGLEPAWLAQDGILSPMAAEPSKR
jgi:hypothetical protein